MLEILAFNQSGVSWGLILAGDIRRTMGKIGALDTPTMAAERSDNKRGGPTSGGNWHLLKHPGSYRGKL